jgi:arylformamidase
LEDEEIIVFKTRNSKILSTGVFQENFCGISLDAAEWLVKSKVSTVWIDYLSVEAIGNNRFPVHHTLLENDVLAIEALLLDGVPEGKYELVCLPICVVGAEAGTCSCISSLNKRITEVPYSFIYQFHIFWRRSERWDCN